MQDLGKKDSKIKIVIFDWSGTVSDDRRSVWAANMLALKEFGIPKVTFEDWLSSATFNAISFYRSQGLKQPDSELLNLYERFLTKIKEEGVVPKVYPDAHETLSFLVRKKTPIAVLSTHPENHLKEEITGYGFDNFVDLVIGDSEDKAKDLHKIKQRFQVQDNNLLFVGDTIFDIRAAKKAGTKSGAILTGYHDKKRLSRENPDFIFENLAEVKSLFE